ncbi:MAG: hypothetical protein ABFD50_23350 [Smithella sp.]
MENLLVNFPDDREVLIDAKLNGRTNQIIDVEAGTHIISLKTPPQNFKPSRKKIVISETSPFTPKEVTFVKI